MNIPTDPEEFVDFLSDREFSSEQILEILNLHDHSPGDCEACGYIDEYGEDFVFETLISRNPESVTEEIIDRSLKYMDDYIQFFEGGNAEFVCYNLALNPKSSQKALQRGSMFYRDRINIGLQDENFPDPEQSDFLDNLREVAAHPKANEEIFRRWLEYGHEALEDWGHEGDIVGCENCQTYLKVIWGPSGFEQYEA